MIWRSWGMRVSRIEGVGIFGVGYPWRETRLVGPRYKCGKCLCVFKATPVNVLILLVYAWSV
jgi:hypothetical protein